MAPSRPSGGRAGPSKPGKNSNKRGGKPVGSKSGGSKSSSSGVSKPRSKSTPSKKGAPARKSIEQLTKGIAKQPTKKKRRTYTEKELGIPALNMITPAGVSKPKGKKKGKVFVDDRESMMTILAMVNADKEGQIESKMMKGRQLEEIRQARAKEMEARQAMRKDKLEATKDSLRRGRKGKDEAPDSEEAQEKTAKNASQPLKRKKRVSFGRDA